MGSARSGPHKDRGVEHHIFNQATGTPVRPFSHLPSTFTDLVRGSGAFAGRYTLSGGRRPMIVIAAVAEHGPRDARQLGGECNHHNVRVCPCE
jgi:hypothetical protein